MKIDNLYEYTTVGLEYYNRRIKLTDFDQINIIYFSHRSKRHYVIIIRVYRVHFVCCRFKRKKNGIVIMSYKTTIRRVNIRIISIIWWTRTIKQRSVMIMLIFLFQRIIFGSRVRIIIIFFSLTLPFVIRLVFY